MIAVSGFVQLPNKTFQWSDGQTGVEKDGFWAFDGLRASGGQFHFEIELFSYFHPKFHESAKNKVFIFCHCPNSCLMFTVKSVSD